MPTSGAQSAAFDVIPTAVLSFTITLSVLMCHCASGISDFVLAPLDAEIDAPRRRQAS